MGEFTIGVWVKARREDVQLHIAEFLTLGEMIGLLRGNSKIRDECGFDTVGEVNDLGGVEELRNRVMHGNRPLVHDREMLESHVGRIERAEALVRRLV